MRIPNDEHEARPWRIREIAPDFTVEDVWALPVYGDAGDFGDALALFASLDPTRVGSPPTRALWRLRELLGEWFDLDKVPADDTSLAGRLPDDLRDTAAGVDFGSLPFEPLYLTDSEFAAEVSNKTVHGVLHLAWVESGEGSYQGQMAVYVKPRGRFGKGYMALIRPFRHWVVYPALMRQLAREAADTAGLRSTARPGTSPGS